MQSFDVIDTHDVRLRYRSSSELAAAVCGQSSWETFASNPTTSTSRHSRSRALVLVLLLSDDIKSCRNDPREGLPILIVRITRCRAGEASIHCQTSTKLAIAVVACKHMLSFAKGTFVKLPDSRNGQTDRSDNSRPAGSCEMSSH